MGQDLHWAVLRPVAAAGMNFPSRARAITGLESQNGTHAGRISRRADQPNAQSRLGALIAIQDCRGRILGHGEVHATITIIISRGGPALFTVNRDTTFRPGNRPQIALAVAQQQQTSPRIAP